MPGAVKIDFLLLKKCINYMVTMRFYRILFYNIYWKNIQKLNFRAYLLRFFLITTVICAIIFFMLLSIDHGKVKKNSNIAKFTLFTAAVSDLELPGFHQSSGTPPVLLEFSPQLNLSFFDTDVIRI